MLKMWAITLETVLWSVYDLVGTMDERKEHGVKLRLKKGKL